MSCKYEVGGWTGHKTLNRIVQIDTSPKDKPEVEVEEQKGNAKNEYILDCIVKYKGKRITEGVSWTDGKGKVLSSSHLLKTILRVGYNVLKCKYRAGIWTGTKTLTVFVKKEIKPVAKPEV